MALYVRYIPVILGGGSGGGGVTSVGPFGTTPNADGGDVSGSVLTLEPASASFPGGVSTTTQSLAGNKTFTGQVATNSASILGGLAAKATGSGVYDGITLLSSGGSQTLGLVIRDNGNIFLFDGSNTNLSFSGINGGTGPASPSFRWEANGIDANTVITSPGAAATMAVRNLDSTVNNFGCHAFVNSANEITSSICGVNESQTPGSAAGHFSIITANAGTMTERFRVAKDGILTASAYGAGLATFSSSGVISSVPLASGNLTDAGADGIVITGGTGAVLGSGTSLAQHVADTSHNGYLSSADWNTFNSKQAAGNYITSLTGDVTASGPGSAAATVAKIQGTVVSGTTGATNVVFSAAPTLTNPVVGTQSQGDSSTKAASTAYVDVAVANAVAGVNPAVAVQAATTSSSDTSSYTYNNGVSGVGATLTGPTNTALTVDGFTFTVLGQRLLVKNDTQSPSGAFNGVYSVTQLQTGILPLILTRALDYDAPSDINNTGTIPVINGTANGTTSWVETALVITVGTTPLAFSLFTRNPADYLLKANNLSDVANKPTSFNNLSPMTTGGDIIYGGASGAATRLPNGSSGQVLTSGGGTAAPSWTPANSGTVSSVTFTGDGTVLSSTPSSAVTTTGTLTAALNTQTARTFLSGPLSGSAATPTFKALTAPTIQKFTSGTGTYTTAAGTLYIRVRMVGGGGSGAQTNGGGSGNDGNDTTFGTALLNAGKGKAGTVTIGGAGGTSSLGSGPIGTALPGGAGEATAGALINASGGNGGASAFGGAGGGAQPTSGASTAGGANTGGGGGGGAGSASASGGGGGGSGGFVDAIIVPTASQTFLFVVGAGGTSSGGGSAAGGSGYIEVTEYYQ